MYENENKAQMAGTTTQQRAYGSGLGAHIPQYGGDCPLKQDGISTSNKRLQDVTCQLAQATWQLREFFGMATPQADQCAPRPSGLQGDLEDAIRTSAISLENVNLVLEHLRS